jgi:hypothetical protein
MLGVAGGRSRDAAPGGSTRRTHLGAAAGGPWPLRLTGSEKKREANLLKGFWRRTPERSESGRTMHEVPESRMPGIQLIRPGTRGFITAAPAPRAAHQPRRFAVAKSINFAGQACREISREGKRARASREEATGGEVEELLVAVLDRRHRHGKLGRRRRFEEVHLLAGGDGAVVVGPQLRVAPAPPCTHRRHCGQGWSRSAARAMLCSCCTACCSACALHALCMRSACALYALCMCSVCALHVLCMCSIRAHAWAVHGLWMGSG